MTEVHETRHHWANGLYPLESLGKTRLLCIAVSLRVLELILAATAYAGAATKNSDRGRTGRYGDLSGAGVSGQRLGILSLPDGVGPTRGRRPWPHPGRNLTTQDQLMESQRWRWLARSDLRCGRRGPRGRVHRSQYVVRPREQHVRSHHQPVDLLPLALGEYFPVGGWDTERGVQAPPERKHGLEVGDS